MKRRAAAALMTGVLCLTGLTACGSQSAGNTAEDAGETYHIAMIVKHTDEHFSKVVAGAEAYAAERGNVTVDVQSPTSATAYDEQLNMIETVLHNDGVDAVVLAPLQSDSAAALVSGTDKPVIALDTDFTSDKKLAFVGTGNEAAAKSGGDAAMEQAKANGADKPNVVILTGAQGDETHEARLPQCGGRGRRYGARDTVLRCTARPRGSGDGGGHAEVSAGC